MEVLAQRLSGDVSLVLVQGEGGWRFSHWTRAADDVYLPRPAASVCERQFESSQEAVDFFTALLHATPVERSILELEAERAALCMRAGQSDALDARWQAAKRRVE